MQPFAERPAFCIVALDPYSLTIDHGTAEALAARGSKQRQKVAQTFR
jgi:hypothetical protein